MSCELAEENLLDMQELRWMLTPSKGLKASHAHTHALANRKGKSKLNMQIHFWGCSHWAYICRCWIIFARNSPSFYSSKTFTSNLATSWWKTKKTSSPPPPTAAAAPPPNHLVNVHEHIFEFNWRECCQRCQDVRLNMLYSLQPMKDICTGIGIRNWLD